MVDHLQWILYSFMEPLIYLEDCALSPPSPLRCAKQQLNPSKKMKNEAAADMIEEPWRCSYCLPVANHDNCLEFGASFIDEIW